MWDLFISYASEDKETIVKQLVENLKKYELNVWYDEFALKIGDSLSKSIDRGLMQSKYGIVILSPNFFDKGWPDYELRGLLTREIGEAEKVILPIWHNIEFKDVVKYSPSLADKYALTTEMDVSDLVYKILEVVKPDLINSHAIMHVSRELKGSAEEVRLNISDIKNGEIVHKSLPNHLVIATKLISSIFYDVTGFTYKDFVLDFARDWDYDHEFLLWSAMASTYIEFINSKKINNRNLNLKKEIFNFLLLYTSGMIVNLDKYCAAQKELTKADYDQLLVLFAVNHDSLFDFFDDDMKKKYKKILNLKR